MDNDLCHLDLLEEAGGNWQKGGNCLFKLLSRNEEDVGGGGGDSNQMYVLGGDIPDFNKECFGEHCIQVVVERVCEMTSGIAIPFLVIMTVLSRFRGATGVLDVGLKPFEAFVDPTLPQICWERAGGGGMRAGCPGVRVGAAGGGGAGSEEPA